MEGILTFVPCDTEPGVMSLRSVAPAGQYLSVKSTEAVEVELAGQWFLREASR